MMRHGILYNQNGCNECVGFSDNDWAGDMNDRKSTCGHLFQSVEVLFFGRARNKAVSRFQPLKLTSSDD